MFIIYPYLSVFHPDFSRQVSYESAMFIHISRDFQFQYQLIGFHGTIYRKLPWSSWEHLAGFRLRFSHEKSTHWQWFIGTTVGYHWPDCQDSEIEDGEGFESPGAEAELSCMGYGHHMETIWLWIIMTMDMIWTIDDSWGSRCMAGVEPSFF